MRKIEIAMNDAVRAIVDGLRFEDKLRRLGNTEITRAPDGAALVSLHGNTIARITRRGAAINTAFYNVVLDSCRWHTPTTKSRLNALLAEFRPGNAVFQKAGAWYVRTPGGNTWPFFDGINI